MGRLEIAAQKIAEAKEAEAVENVEEMSAKPDDIPADVWNLIQENGRLATERLHQILSSPKFTRLRAGDQAKLIALAQNRAYGNPKVSGAGEAKKKVGRHDVIANELAQQAYRASLPEYKRAQIEDADFTPIREEGKDNE